MNRQIFLPLGCCLLIALPFLAVNLPPITDLPQQTAQIRLLIEGDDAYRAQLWHPNKLGYVPIAVGWLIGGPLAAGRLGMFLIGVSWMLGLYLLAVRTERSPAVACLAGLFFFNHLTYWGFLNFLVGLPVFVLWFLLIEGMDEPPDTHRGWVLTLAAWLLYTAHVLWLAAGLVWLMLRGFQRTRQTKLVARCLLWTLPVLALVAAWYPSLARGGFDSGTVWGQSLLERLHPNWWLNSALGGMHGKVEPLIAIAVLLWIGLGVLQHRRNLRDAIHPGLLFAASFFALATLTLPGVTQHTIFFASRWVPIAVVFLILGSPSPNLRPALKNALALALVAVLSLATAVNWMVFEVEELDGLETAIRALPEDSRVLGLDFVRQSERIQGFPFYHLYAYSQVLRGGELNRSFANEASSLMVYRDLPRQLPWTDGLDWNAKKLRRSDVPHFDFVIVHGGADFHALFQADPQLEYIQLYDSDPPPWRLYKVRRSNEG